MNKEIQEWLKEKSKKTLSKLGIEPGMKVLDFGAREGYNTLPAAEIVTPRGEVFAVDEDEEALNILAEKVSERSLKNVHIINNKGKSNLALNDNSIDFIILFDVYHELKNSGNYLKEFQRILKSKGIISIFDPHVSSMEKVKKQVTSFDFRLNNSFKLDLLHNYSLTEGEINKFIKNR